MPVSNPAVTYNIIPGQQEISNAPQRAIIVAQKTSAGSATSGQLLENILNDNSENALAGENSMFAAMVRAFKGLNQVTRLDGIVLDDNGAGVAATGSIALASNATADAILEVIIGSIENHSYLINVTNLDTPTIMGDAIEAAINADTKAPVTASNASGTVTLTAVNKGTPGNSIGIRTIGTIPGTTITLTAMSGGATDPVLTDVLDVVAEERYQTNVSPSEYGTDFWTDFLGPRENVNNNVLDGVAILHLTDTFSNLETAGNAENSKSLVLFGDKTINTDDFKGPGILELNYVKVAQFAALRALRLTPGSNISQFVIATNGPLDTFGGPEIASLPYFNTPNPNLPIIDTGNDFESQLEVPALRAAGISNVGNNIPRTSIIYDQIVTTRKTDSAGNPETTFKFLNAVDTSSVVRELFFNNSKARFAQTRLTAGDLVPGRSNDKVETIRAFMVALFNSPSIKNILVQGGEDALKFFKQNLNITADIASGDVTIFMKVPIVSQLRNIDAVIQIEFTINLQT